MERNKNSLLNELQIKDLLEEIKASKDEGYISGELICVERI